MLVFMRDNYKEMLLDRVMYDIKQVSTNIYYADLLIDQQVKRGKDFNLVISLFSAGGLALSLINLIFPVITSAVVAIMPIIKQYFNVYYMSDDNRSKLNELRISHHIYLRQLQNIFDKLFYDLISIEEAQLQYDKVTNDNSEKLSLISNLFGKIDKKLNDKAASKSDKYLNEIYNGNIQ